MPRKIVQEITGVDKTAAAFNSVTRRINGLKSAFVGLGAAVGIGGITAFVKSQVDAADKIGKLSTQLGISTEALSQYQFVAEQTGVEFDTFTTALQRLTRRISDAASGTGPAIDALNELGLSAQALEGLSLEDQFEAIARQFENVKGSSDRVRLAFSLFDSEGVRLLRTLDQGAGGIRGLREEADELGLTLTNLDTSRAAAVADAFNRIENIARSLARNLAFELLPIFEELAVTIRNDFVPAFRDFLESLNLIKPKSRSIEELRQKIAGVEQSIVSIQSVIDRAGVLGLDEQQLAATNKALSDQQQQLKEYQRSLNILTGDTAALNAQLEEQEAKQRSLLGTNERLTKSTQARISPITKYIEALQKESEILGLSNAELREYELRQLGATQSQIQRALALQDQIDAYEAINKIEEENQRIMEQSAEAVKQQREELQRFADALTRSVNPAQEVADELARIEEAFAANLITIETYSEAVFKAFDGMKEGAKEAAESTDTLKSLGEELGPIISSSFEDAIAEGKKFSDVLKGLEQDLIRLLTRRLVTRPLADTLGGFLDNLDLGSIFGRAVGGPVARGTPYVVGEQGPEVFVPSTNGRIEPNVGGNTINVIVQGVQDDASFMRNRAQIARAAAQALRQAEAAV